MKANLVFSFALIFCASCGSGSSPAGRPIVSTDPALASGSPGGYWVGADSDGYDVAMLVDEEGIFYFVAGSLRLGAGILTVMGQEGIGGVVSLSRDSDIPSQSFGVDCKLAGTFIQRQWMILDVSCKNVAGQQVFTTFTLNYDSTYERDSSLEMIAGQFMYAGNDVMNISSDGSIFSQNGNSGCITSGAVATKNTAFNVYGIKLELGNCASVKSELRGRTLLGMGMLDNSADPEELLIVVSTNVNGSFMTLMRSAQRL